MSLMLAEPLMAKSKGRPKGTRDDVTVKIDRRIAVRARTVAGFLGVSIGALLSEMLDQPVMEAYAEMVRQMPTGRPAPKKGGPK